MITVLGKLDAIQKKQFIRLFADNFFYMLDPKKKKTDKLTAVFENAFLSDYSYAYIDNGKVAGIISCSNMGHTAVRFDKEFCEKVFGRFAGRMHYNTLMRYFGYPIVKSANEGFIDFLCVDKNHRRKGVASSLLDYVYDNTGYRHYVLEVLSKNTGAIKLYKLLGYKQTDIKKSFWLWLAMKDHLISMKYSKNRK